MKSLIGAVTLILLLIVGYLVFICSGVYNISAMVHHDKKMTLWMMNTVRENSIKHNTEDDIKIPDLTNTSSISMSFVNYREMCVGCWTNTIDEWNFI